MVPLQEPDHAIATSVLEDMSLTVMLSVKAHRTWWPARNRRSPILKPTREARQDFWPTMELPATLKCSTTASLMSGRTGTLTPLAGRSAAFNAQDGPSPSRAHKQGV